MIGLKPNLQDKILVLPVHYGEELLEYRKTTIISLP